MAHLKSGLWCDLCRKPILLGDWWHIRVEGKEGHACQKCKDEYEKRRETAGEVKSENTVGGFIY